MRSSEASSSPLLRSRKTHNLRSSKTESSDPMSLSSKTPEKPPQLTRRTRNRGVALSVAEIRKVAEGLQDRSHQKQHNETTSLKGKSARRQIALPSPRKPKTAAEEPFKLPEKYDILGEFFDSLDSSIRLLRLKGSMPTFTNISPKIECLTDRRFTQSHLAQLKFILPEAIVIKKLLLFDERTSCMKPDLHITVNPDAVESDGNLVAERGSVSLRKLFRARLRDFCKSHPEGDEIPEEILPEPFNHPKQDRPSDILKTPSSAFATETSSDACEAYPPRDPAGREENSLVPSLASIEALNQQPAVATHMAQSFKRRFSKKSNKNGADNVQKNLPIDSFQPLTLPVAESSPKKSPSFVGTTSHPKTVPLKLSSEAANSEISPTNCASPDCCKSSCAPPATSSKTIEYTENKDGSPRSIDATSTPAKLVSTPSRLMSATPALPPPKRHYMSPDDNYSSSMNKLVRRPPRSRSLKFDTPMKNKGTENEDNAGGLSIDDDIYDILPENLVQSIREKERIAMDERDPAISQAKRRQKMIAYLPKLFNMIHILIHSINRSVITKEELVSKIISSHCDIVDRREVEEQLNLLLELVPEWISEKLASSGDFLFCINKMLNPETIRASLEEAK